MIKTKSIFEPAEANDGKRVLVSLTWPKNLLSQDIDSWIKELGHPWELVSNWPKSRITWDDFKNEYYKILKKKQNQYFLQTLAKQGKENNITLLCSCKIENKCHRSILKEYLENFSEN